MHLRQDLDYDPDDEAAVNRYLDAGFQELVERMSELDQFSVGDGIQVEFTDDMVREHSIGKYGRMSQERGINVFHAGPLGVDTTLRYEMTYQGHMEEFERWSQNEQVTFEFPDKYEPPPPVRPTNPTTLHKVERDLMEMAGNLVDRLHLAYPSEGTLWRTEKIECTVSVQPERRAEVDLILKRMNKTVQFLEEGDPSFLHYLGSNGPWERESLPAKWFALVPNPFQDKFPYEPHSLVKVDSGVAVSYLRNGLTQQFVLEMSPSYYMIPPHALAQKFSVTSDAFFLATNYKALAEDFPIPPIRNAPFARYVHCDLPVMPPFDRDGISKDETMVYDILGPGTYASRMQQMEIVGLMLGLTPTYLTDTPTKYEVTYYGQHPHLVVDVQQRDGIRSYIGPFIVGTVLQEPLLKKRVQYTPLHLLDKEPKWQEYIKGQKPPENPRELRGFRELHRKIWCREQLKEKGSDILDVDTCIVYGPLMENGSRFKDFIGNYIEVPCVYHGGVTKYVTIAIPPQCKRPLYVFRNFKHMVMSQFELCEQLAGRGLKPNSRYGDMGRTQKIPTSMLISKIMTYMTESDLSDEAGHLGVSDVEVALKMGITPGQAESIMINSPSLIYLGQWRRLGKVCGYWIMNTRFTETREGRLVTDYLREWRSSGMVVIDEQHSEYFQWFFYHQGRPPISIRPFFEPSVVGFGKLMFRSG